MDFDQSASGCRVLFWLLAAPSRVWLNRMGTLFVALEHGGRERLVRRSAAGGIGAYSARNPAQTDVRRQKSGGQSSSKTS